MMEVDGFTILTFIFNMAGGNGVSDSHSSGGSENLGFTYS